MKICPKWALEISPYTSKKLAEERLGISQQQDSENISCITCLTVLLADTCLILIQIISKYLIR